MKAVLTVKMKAGFLLIEREIIDLTAEEVCAGTVVGRDGYSYRDKVGQVAADLLEPKEAPGE